MIEDQKVLAIIPARGGSKGLPRKNILPLGDKPLIAWSIDAARASKYIDRVICSTDDQDICDVAREYGCDVPFMRPSALATDSATSLDTVVHAIENSGDEYDIIVLLQPTSPFRSERHIDEAIELHTGNRAWSTTSVCEVNKSPEWMFWVDEQTHEMSSILSGVDTCSRRQESKVAHVLNGALFVNDRNELIERQRFIDEQTLAYFMEKRSSIDIDVREDLEYAKFLLEQ